MTVIPKPFKFFASSVKRLAFVVFVVFEFNMIVTA